MKKNLFLIALILVSLILIFVISQQEQSFKTDDDKQPIISSPVYKQIQRAAQINITKDNQTVTFNKINQKWVVTEKDNYPLDMVKLRKLISQLTTGKLLEKKTNNAKLLSKLGLDDANATYITLSSDDSSTFKLAIGNNKGSNTYIRVYPENFDAQTWLASGDLTTQASSLEWLDTAILQLPSKEITSIEFFNKDKIVSHLHKTTPEDKKFTIKTGKKNSPKDLNSTGSMLSDLTFLDVKQDKRQHKGRYTKIITADGMVLTLKMHQDSSSYWVSIDTAFDEKLISSKATKSQEDSDTKKIEAELSQEQQLASKVKISRIKEKITQISNRVKGWQYQITQEQYNLLIGN